MPACPSRGPLVFAPQRGVPNPSAVRELKSLSSTHYALWLHGGLPLAEYLTRNRLALTSPLELPALRVSVTPLPAARPAPREGRGIELGSRTPVTGAAAPRFEARSTGGEWANVQPRQLSQQLSSVPSASSQDAPTTSAPAWGQSQQHQSFQSFALAPLQEPPPPGRRGESEAGGGATAAASAEATPWPRTLLPTGERASAPAAPAPAASLPAASASLAAAASPAAASPRPGVYYFKKQRRASFGEAHPQATCRAPPRDASVQHTRGVAGTDSHRWLVGGPARTRAADGARIRKPLAAPAPPLRGGRVGRCGRPDRLGIHFW